MHTQWYMKKNHHRAYHLKHSLAGKLQNYGFKATLLNVQVEKEVTYNLITVLFSIFS